MQTKNKVLKGELKVMIFRWMKIMAFSFNLEKSVFKVVLMRKVYYNWDGEYINIFNMEKVCNGQNSSINSLL